MPTQLLDDLRPRRAQRVIDLVSRAGVDVSDWKNFRGTDPSRNPKYCYEWSFAQPKEIVVLNLWFEQMQEVSGTIVQHLEFKGLRSEVGDNPKVQAWQRRRRRLEQHVRTAYSEGLPVRVIVCDGDRRDANETDPSSSVVKKRQLDPATWAVTNVNFSDGTYTLTRGATPAAAPKDKTPATHGRYLAVAWTDDNAKGYVDLVPSDWLVNPTVARGAVHRVVSATGKISSIKCGVKPTKRGTILDYTKHQDYWGNKQWDPYALRVLLDTHGQLASVQSSADENSEFTDKGILSTIWIDDVDAFLNSRLNRSGATRRPGQPGPPPSSWSATTRRIDGPTSTYILRFGDRDVWKIGISQNVYARCDSLNYSVPHEVLKERWTIFDHKEWPNGETAYKMEQALLGHFGSQQCERIHCSQVDLLKSWTRYLRQGQC